MSAELTPEDRIRRAALAFEDPDEPGVVTAIALAGLARRQRRRAVARKTCVWCNEPQPLSGFGADATAEDGLERRCRSCRRRPRPKA